MITTVHLIVDQKHYPELIMKVENDIVNIALHILLKIFLNFSFLKTIPSPVNLRIFFLIIMLR